MAEWLVRAIYSERLHYHEPNDLGGHLAARFEPINKIIPSTLESSESRRSREDAISIYTPCQVRPSEAETMEILVLVSPEIRSLHAN